MLKGVCHAIEISSFAKTLDSSVFWWPMIETTHLIAMVLLVGSITTFDVRLLGFAMRGLSVSQLGERLLPATWTAFAISVLTGALLFASEAEKKYCFNPAF